MSDPFFCLYDVMRQIFHTCLASHGEVMFRSEEDLARGFNCFAVACLETDSTAMSDGFLPSHFHTGVRTECVDELLSRQRYSYTRYFNNKYHRKGGLGEKKPFILPLEGIRHTLAGLSYINRQALHRGICETPFAYRHCSANAFFRKQLGKWELPELLGPKTRWRFVSETSRLPESYRMTASGALLREDVIDVNYVEELYVTPRNFLYYMNRVSDGKWMQGQLDESKEKPAISLENVEDGVEDTSVPMMLAMEKGRVNNWLHTDMSLCDYIDNQLVPKHFDGLSEKTIYDIPIGTRREIGNKLAHTMMVGTQRISSFNQIRRCLVI